MVAWHHRLNGHEFEQARGVGDGQGSLYSAVHGLQSWTPRGSLECNPEIPAFPGEEN